ncbi:hypothetical protein I316_02960 [Kwoniella heveanensis BCC8398]|uniref:Uncharacterized protein n=1 Tax=Kwoniella heveanensis BCC8398 TaxID=1296120 RepID=A0A1B9GWJ9_9TREE|nr:hypothetical protein I316_02960 [Kwoniella heveanensis BCC8398]
MSVLRLQAARLFRPNSAPSARVLSRGLASSVHNNDPEVLDKEKAKNLQGKQDDSAPHKEHAPGWNENLASDSEANVKADQAAPTGKPGKDLQDKTVEHTHKKHRESPTESEEDIKADRGPNPFA